jgi:selenocysteine lyase/cysteine desulfurase
VLLALAPSGIGFEVGAEDGGATRLAGAVGAFGQALQGAVHVIEDALGMGQLGLISLFHGGRVPRPRTGLRIPGPYPGTVTDLPPAAELVGAGLAVPCLDGTERPYRDLDCAASTPALRVVADTVTEFLPWYSSVHRGAGYKSRRATAAYEAARDSVHRFAGRTRDRDDVVILCRNTTEAINHLAYRLGLESDDVVATTVVEHHANLLPWARVAKRRWVECGTDGTFGVEDVTAVLDAGRPPALLALTGASNVTGWLPPVAEICAEAHARGIPVLLDAAQLAPHRPLPPEPDFIAFSGHKLYAPYGAGALIGPRRVFATGDPFLAGGGAVDLVDLDEVIWTDPPDREEAGSPNVIGAVAFGAAMDELARLGWEAIGRHEAALSARLHEGLRAIEGVNLLGPGAGTDTLSVATFTVEGMHHALVAARLSAEWGIGVRHGCFCAHPYLLRLLGVGPQGVAEARAAVERGDRRDIPGAVRASCGLGTSGEDVDSLLTALRALTDGAPAPVTYVQDAVTGDYWPEGQALGWGAEERPTGAACARG